MTRSCDTEGLTEKGLGRIPPVLCWVLRLVLCDVCGDVMAVDVATRGKALHSNLTRHTPSPVRNSDASPALLV